MKRKYKGKYQEFVKQREQEKQREIMQKAQDLREMLVGIDLDVKKRTLSQKRTL